MEEEIPKRFEYSDCPIRSRTEIRILNLLPPINSDLDALHCTLSVATLEDKPSYEALSYVWGPPVFPERLYLPSGHLSITANLAAALRQFRYSDRQRQLWVDAVCIDQQNHVEKAYQVRLMSQLYRNTECVLAWLGESHSNTRAIFGILEGLAAAHQLFEVNRDASFFEVIQMTEFEDPETETNIQEFANSLFSSPIMNTLLHLPWFERLWIIQEAVLPSRAQICWGCETLDLDRFMLSIKVFLRVARKSPTSVLKDWLHIVFLCDLRESFHDLLVGHGGNKTRLMECNLFNLATNFSSSKACQNDMDRIFGLLGLQSNEERWFEANYEGSVESVYFDFALKAFGSVNPERILREAIRRYDSTGNPHQSMSIRLPSWVADWRYTGVTSEFSIENFQSATSLPKNHSCDIKNLPFVGFGGVKVDTIAHELSTIFSNRDELHSLEDIWKSHPTELINLKDFLLEHLPIDTSLAIEDVTEAFIRTILSDRAFVRSLQGDETKIDLGSLYTWWLCFENNYTNETDGSTFPVNSEKARVPRETSPRSGNFIITKTGHMGIGPLFARTGDVVAIFDGFTTPYILRPVLPDQPLRPPVYSPNKEEGFVPDEQWEVIGECYLYGFMDNQVAEPPWRAKSDMFWIT